MKKAEEYLEEEINKLHDSDQPWYDEGVYDGGSDVIIKAIKQAQLEAIEETVKLCSEKAKLLFHDGFWKEDKQLEYFQSGENNLQISKQSILNCAEILKKEIG